MEKVHINLSPQRTQSVVTIFLLWYEKVLTLLHRTRMARFSRSSMDNFNPCESVSSAQSVFHHQKSAFICVHLRLIKGVF